MIVGNTTQFLLDFAHKLENKNIIGPDTGIKIRSYIRREESPTYWELFLILGGLLGAGFASAGVFSIIAHNWDDYPKHLRGFFSVVPALVGLYFYYRMLFHHKDSKAWIEASSLFLMMMIGASIALVSQTYQMDGDFNKFIKVWMVLTVPLFYLARASGIALIYLLLSMFLLLDVGIGAWGIPRVDISEENYWYWILFLAFLPHYFLSIDGNSKKQGLRVVFLSYCVYFSLIAALAVSVKSNYLLWFATVNVGFYLVGKWYMSGNAWFLSRPFQFLSQLYLGFVLLSISNESTMYFTFQFDSIFNYETWEGKEIYYFILLLIVMAGVYFNYFRFREKIGEINPLIILIPPFILLLMFIDEYTISWWWLSLPINFFILLIGIVTMVQGSEKGQVFKMVAGLLLIAFLLIARYFDTSLGFVSKGILFIAIGGLFFMINLFVKEKVEDIERQKKLANEE